MRRRIEALLLISSVFAPANLRAQDKDVEGVVSTTPLEAFARPTLSMGIDASTGRYGGPDTTRTLISPITLRVPVSAGLTLSTSIARVQISGPNVVVGPDGRPLPGVGLVRSTRAGIGDLSFGASWEVPLKSDHWSIQTSGRIKIPTSQKSKGLSTGKTDFAGKIEVTYIAGAFAPFASLEYQVMGKPAGLAFRNTINTSVGTAWISGKNAIIASYDYNQSISGLIEDGHSLFGAYSTPVSEKLRLTLYGIKGLSAGSANVEGGAILSIAF